MGTEIERKFLVDKEKLSAYSMIFTLGSSIKQGYLSDDGKTAVRVRTKDNKGYITIKQSTDSDVTRLEYEYEIPYEDAIDILSMCKSVIDKQRYYLSFNGYHKWEIDVFEGKNHGLIIAELELESEDEEFDIPDFVIKEVTGEAEYLNSNLVEFPYNTWSKDD